MYTIVRWITGIFVAITFTANCIATILFGAMARDPDAYHGYVIFSIVSGMVVSAMTGTMGYIAMTPSASCHGSEVSKGHLEDFWRAITAVVTFGAMYFWLATLVALVAKHHEIIPVAVIASVYTVGMMVGIFKVVRLWRAQN